MPTFSLPASAPYKALQQHLSDAKQWQMRDLFKQDSDRFDKFSLEAAGLFIDFSKNIINENTLSLLCDLARDAQVESQREAMFAGEKINLTEKRAVLHTALRRPASDTVMVDGHNVVPDAHAVLDRMGAFAERVRNGTWRGYDDREITDIVNIGIGGSYLGPKMTCQALRPFVHSRLKLHFISNVDGHDLAALLPQINPATTLFIIASKTFTTSETMTNAQSARAWLLRSTTEAHLAKHFVAVSTQTDLVTRFGIAEENMFPFWDWVGGRYSVWSAIGLSLAIAIGIDNFKAFLAGAHAMDQHFRTAPLEKNLPALMGLVGIWNRNFLGSDSVSIAPYHQDLALFPGYLQQLEMESNGKRVHVDGNAVDFATCPVIWGDTGTNGQHAYFQLLHQGSDVIPVDFIAVLKPSHQLPLHQERLLANCFAQSEAFMRGKSADEVRKEMQAQGVSDNDIELLIPHRTFPGNRPSTTILLDELTPAALGALIALYEHKVFVQGVVWGLNSFDQWGVELGKVLAKTIEGELTGATASAQHDGSTNGLIARARTAAGKSAA
ncbi:MAG: glucose-6-phosphate isomerase [Oxalicibacterium faecigallinarum]|uniref:glucose-6-phosphate isomerase n=1 Tax=Oxalicibacterium faecigallinarum TaxID=573741 RepID=UPI0028083638|nr:glucose-6-phosphate isomerase [Oxalicibacterium faecigallinarum]MDQ7968376.1 glucose-6-phosphate isomerase [Oxalicibacterium faecigallinarum]